jgi:hypothetical protein
VDSSRRRFFCCFSWVLYSLAFTTKTKLSALISSLIGRTREKSTKLRFFCDSQKNRRKCIKTLGSKVFFEVSPVYSIVFLQKKTFDGESVCGWGRANNRAKTRVATTLPIPYGSLLLCWYNIIVAPLKNLMGKEKTPFDKQRSAVTLMTKCTSVCKFWHFSSEMWPCCLLLLNPFILHYIIITFTCLCDSKQAASMRNLARDSRNDFPLASITSSRTIATSYS